MFVLRRAAIACGTPVAGFGSPSVKTISTFCTWARSPCAAVNPDCSTIFIPWRQNSTPTAAPMIIWKIHSKISRLSLFCWNFATFQSHRGRALICRAVTLFLLLSFCVSVRRIYQRKSNELRRSMAHSIAYRLWLVLTDSIWFYSNPSSSKPILVVNLSSSSSSR